MKIPKNELIFYAIFLVLILIQAIFLFVPRVDNHLIGNDGAYYYSYLRSFIYDQDINLINEIEIYNSTLPSGPHVNIGMFSSPFSTYAYAIGSSILWLPFYLFSTLLISIASILGFNPAVNGYSLFQEAAVCFASMFYSFAGIILIFKFTKNYFSPGISLISTIAVIFSTPAIYYILFEPSMSHANTIFSTSLFLYIYYFKNTTEESPGKSENIIRQKIILGLSAGIMLLVRWQDIVFLFPLFSEIFFDFKKGKNDNSPSGKIFLSIVPLIVAFFVFVPQLLFWKDRYGKFFVIPQGENFINWLEPKVIDVLFTTQHGLISWTPLIFFSIAGLFTLYKTNKKLSLDLIAIFILNLYVNSCIIADIGGGASFGMRRFVSCTLIFTVGLAGLIQYLSEKTKFFPLKRICLILLFFIFWNGLFIIQYRLGFIDPIAPLTWKEMITDKFLIPEKIYHKW